MAIPEIAGPFITHLQNELGFEIWERNVPRTDGNGALIEPANLPTYRLTPSYFTSDPNYEDRYKDSGTITIDLWEDGVEKVRLNMNLIDEAMADYTKYNLINFGAIADLYQIVRSGYIVEEEYYKLKTGQYAYRGQIDFAVIIESCTTIPEPP